MTKVETITLDYTGIGPVHGVKTIDLNGVSRTCAYDANGNMITSPDFTNATNPLNRAITYDGDNMPTRIVHANGKTVDFVYDGVGKRTKKAVSGGKTVLYLGDHFEVENGVNIKYIFGGNLRLAMIKGSLTSYFHKDHLGSTAAVTNEAGVKVESPTYEPFGSTRTQEGTVVSNYKFTDQELDNETNLYNYDARLYDPVLGMFVTPDSVVPNMFDPQDLNRYAYCRNNPLIYVDPSGHTLANPNDKSDMKGIKDDPVSIQTNKDWEKACLAELKREEEYIKNTSKFIASLMKQLFPELENIKKSLKPARQQAIIDAAKKYIGTRYVSGGDGKEGRGIDCSHLIDNAFDEAGFDYSYSTTKNVETNPALTKIENPSVFNEQKGDLKNYGNGPGTQGHMGLVDPDSPDPSRNILSATESGGVRYGPDKWFSEPATDYKQIDVYRLKELMEE